jgi:hypothetical protein
MVEFGILFKLGKKLASRMKCDQMLVGLWNSSGKQFFYMMVKAF